MSNDLPAASSRGAGVLVVGSANVDLLVDVPQIPQPGETVLGGELRYAPGGKGANQAVAAARLGAATAFVGRVGDDEAGARTRQQLTDEGIDCRWLRETAGTATGTALIAVDPAGENTIVVAPGANARLTAADVPAAAEGAAVVVTQLETSVAPTCLALARSVGARFLLNAAPAPRDLAPELVTGADPLVVNVHEAAALLALLGISTAGTAAEQAEALGEQATSVVVTAGADGAWWYAGRLHHVPAVRVDTVVDTTGAGDTFVGALAASLARGDDLDAAVEHAVRAAAWSVRLPGAQPSMPRLEDLAAT